MFTSVDVISVNVLSISTFELTSAVVPLTVNVVESIVAPVPDNWKSVAVISVRALSISTFELKSFNVALL